MAEVRRGGGGAGAAAAQEDRRSNTDESRAEEAFRKVLPLLQGIPGADLLSLMRCSTRLRELVTDAIKRGWQRCARFNARPVIVTVEATERRAEWVPDGVADHPIAQVKCLSTLLPFYFIFLIHLDKIRRLGKKILISAKGTDVIAVIAVDFFYCMGRVERERKKNSPVPPHPLSPSPTCRRSRARRAPQL